MQTEVRHEGAAGDLALAAGFAPGGVAGLAIRTPKYRASANARELLIMIRRIVFVNHTSVTGFPQGPCGRAPPRIFIAAAFLRIFTHFLELKEMFAGSLCFSPKIG